MRETRSVDLVCQVKGYPNFTVQWFRAGQNVTHLAATVVASQNASHVVKTSTLSIVSVTRENMTEFTCVAGNMVGEKNTSALLNVTCKIFTFFFCFLLC